MVTVNYQTSLTSMDVGCFVLQCHNGHTLCTTCCNALDLLMKCPSCSLSIVRDRNIAVEKILEAVQVRCEHFDSGCNAILKYIEQQEHEERLCEYRPHHAQFGNARVLVPRQIYSNTSRRVMGYPEMKRSRNQCRCLSQC